MADPVLNYPLQNLGSGDELALALKEYSGLVLANFPTATVALNYGQRRSMPRGSGKSWQFPAFWRMSGAYHTAGVTLGGENEPITEERLVTMDTKAYIAHAWLDDVSDFIQHFDTRQQIAVESARDLARHRDSITFQCIINGARQAARSSFPAGNTLDSPRTGPISTAYPVSLAGSKNLQSDLAEIAQKMDEKNVPRMGRVAFLTPYLLRVLRQDKTLATIDYKSPNNNITRQMVMVEGFMVEETNQMPSANITSSSVTGHQTAYQGNYTTTVCCCVGSSDAFGTIYYADVQPIGPHWDEVRQAWLIGAKQLAGSNWLRPEACGEIAIAS